MTFHPQSRGTALSLPLLLIAASAFGQVSTPYAGPVEVAVGDTVHLETDLRSGRLCRLAWASLDPTVAIVDRRGVLAAVSPGATSLHVEATGDHEPCIGTAAVHVRVLDRPPEGAVPRIDHALVRRESRPILDRALHAVCGDINVGTRPVYLDPVPLSSPGDDRHPEGWLRDATGTRCVAGVTGRDETVPEPVWLRARLSSPRLVYGGEVEVEYTLSGVLFPSQTRGFRTRSFIRLSRADGGWRLVEVRLESIT